MNATGRNESVIASKLALLIKIGQMAETAATYLRFPDVGAAGRCVSWLLRVEIGVYKDEVVRWRGPDQARALSSLAHPAHPQFKQRSRP
jgi:hypothetical protein